MDRFVAGFVGTSTYEPGLVHHVDAVGQMREVGRGVQVARSKGCLRLVLISDTHERHRLLSLPPGDVLIHCGDLLALNTHYTAETTARKLKDFNEWMAGLPYREKVVVAGNHDAGLEALGRSAASAALGACVYLENESRQLQCGLKVFGTPASVANSSHSANRAFQYSEEFLEEIFADAPRDADVLVTHGPLDSLAPARRYLRESPSVRLCAWGHVHEQHGAGEIRSGTVAINASTMDHTFSPMNPPTIFDLPLPAARRSKL